MGGGYPGRQDAAGRAEETGTVNRVSLPPGLRLFWRDADNRDRQLDNIRAAKHGGFRRLVHAEVEAGFSRGGGISDVGAVDAEKHIARVHPGAFRGERRIAFDDARDGVGLVQADAQFSPGKSLAIGPKPDKVPHSGGGEHAGSFGDLRDPTREKSCERVVWSGERRAVNPCARRQMYAEPGSLEERLAVQDIAPGKPRGCGRGGLKS